MFGALGLLAATALAVPGVVRAQAAASGRASPETARRYAAAEALADPAPPAVEGSVGTLAAYLSRAGDDDLTRARALFRWVAGHITYDVAGLRSGAPGAVRPDSVLRLGRSECQGFANLTQALGEAMGLDVAVVSGWSKGYGYVAGQQPDGPTNHAWNAVRIAGRWRLMDPTWGAGYLDDSLRFVRRFQDHYFLTDPRQFVFDHLPDEPRWQLLDRPVTAAEYADLVYLRPAFFDDGLRIGDHTHLVITADSTATVTLGLTRPVQLMAELRDAATQRPLDGEHAFVQVDTGEARIYARFPEPGAYLLRVFAKPLGAAGALDWTLDYLVRASGGTPDALFPATYTAFSSRRVWLTSPMDGVLQAGRQYRFRLRAPGALEVVVLAGQRWTRLDRWGDEFAGNVTAAPGDVVVYGKYRSGVHFEGLLRYTGR